MLLNLFQTIDILTMREMPVFGEGVGQIMVLFKGKISEGLDRFFLLIKEDEVIFFGKQHVRRDKQCEWRKRVV